MNGKISSRLLVLNASNRLREAGSESPYLDATLLLASVWGVTREKLFTLFGDPVEPDDAAAFKTLVERRIAGEPIAYLIGSREFYGHRFMVDRHVLVPRPDTEILVDTVLGLCPEGESWRIHDCCTGSGCVAISVSAARPRASVSMSDISGEALDVAVVNSNSILGESLPYWKSDLLAEVPGRFNVITCNPPYLTGADMSALDEPSDTPAASERTPRHEPKEALYGGNDGLEFVNRLIHDALASLASNGYIVLEIADAQAEPVMKLLETAGYRNVFVQRDLAGRRRVVGGQACSDTTAN